MGRGETLTSNPVRCFGWSATRSSQEQLKYLGQRGIVTLVIVAQHGMLGQGMHTPVDTSYMADSVILFRYFEAGSEIRQAISTVKKRKIK